MLTTPARRLAFAFAVGLGAILILMVPGFIWIDIDTPSTDGGGFDPIGLLLTGVLPVVAAVLLALWGIRTLRASR